MSDNTIKNALFKCAVGFDTEEVVEEFAMQEGQLTLVKRKVTKRDVPPDLKAVKMLMENDDISGMTDEQLKRERERLINLLKENQIDEN